MSNTSTSETTSLVCANCGKGEEAGKKPKACTACKLVKYCSRECQIAHRPQHKKECKKKAAELHDEKLFKQPPPNDDCPICMLQLPKLESGSTYMACCGKVICSGCVYTFRSRATKKEHDKCPFCRTPPPYSGEEMIKRYKKRMDLNDAEAIFILGCYYARGENGLPRNQAKALELWHRAAELGNALAYSCIGYAYTFGRGVEVDGKKAKHYWELAAMGGSAKARQNLGLIEAQAGNRKRAIKHWMIAASCGISKSLESIKSMYKIGDATKNDYAEALRSYQAYLDDIKSDQREEAAAYDNRFKYYESAL